MFTTMRANCVGPGLTPPIVSFYRKKFQLDNHNCYKPSTGGYLSQSYQSHCRRAQGTQKQNEWVYTTVWDIVGNQNTSRIQVCWFQQITNFLPFRDNKQTSSKVQMSAAARDRKQNSKCTKSMTQTPTWGKGFSHWDSKRIGLLYPACQFLTSLLFYEIYMWSHRDLNLSILISGKSLQSVYALLHRESLLSVDKLKTRIFHPIFSECILGQQNRQKFANTLTHS